MPKPLKGESEKAFMSRCIPMVVKEGKKAAQAFPICSNLFLIKPKNNGKKK